MRLLVTGTKGQVVSALAERAPLADVEIFRLGRPELDLTASAETVRDTVVEAVRSSGAQAIVSAAAYTAVDKAETDIDAAMAANGVAPGAIAAAAALLAIPVIHLSTDYVFDGAKASPWLEDDATGPLGIYGRSKLAGEAALRAACDDVVILRTAWVYSPFGANFVRTMLRLAAEGRGEVRVVDDQRGCPTSALDIADAIIAVAGRLHGEIGKARLRGIFHLAGTGQASWAEFASAIFAGAALRGVPAPRVVPISSKDYPTPAVRPRNSCLDTGLLANVFALRLPPWERSLDVVLDRLLGPAG